MAQKYQLNRCAYWYSLAINGWSKRICAASTIAYLGSPVAERNKALAVLL